MDSVSPGPTVPRAYYPPVSLDILDVRVDNTPASQGKRTAKLSGRDGQHMFLGRVASADTANGNSTPTPKSHLLSGYKPFNPSLLADFETLGGISRGSDLVWSTHAAAGSATSSNDPDRNPFRRARLNQGFPVPTASDDTAQVVPLQASSGAATTGDHSATSLTMRDDFPPMNQDLGVVRPNPRVEVDPQDYG